MDIDTQEITVELDPKEVRTDKFAREIDLRDYIVYNIESFCKDILTDKLISFEVDYPVEYNYSINAIPRIRRVDLLIKCENKLYIIELKNPTHPTENRQGLGQLLDYGREFDNPKKELILLTTLFDINTARTIKHYNLPIRYIFFDKNKTLEYKDDKNK